MNFKLILFLISLSISLVLSFLLYKQWTLAAWFDALFLIGLLLIMIYSVMILIEGQFFTAFLKSTRNFFAKTNKKDQLIRESEKRSLESVSFRREFPHRTSFLQIGLFFCIGSLLISSAMYFLS
ncbi:hypothetical protein GPDM_12482 [Planococcus donghaensis MPA1U2]|uniref:DUF3899 domain-containing protein n=1 Tax=Planococcus donghaensis MPA1U2 TaxID=933115 RepID=E7RJ31_9BACL|nr:DUF3899 domain-containing protein [Planococcus donghaensis]EGA89041.1 hypothetical protein GPDM_12482 [Planococcus donghaensis MPA1U2]